MEKTPDAFSISSFGPELAANFVSHTLVNVAREFPHKLDHVLNDATDARGPRDLHPIFYGCFDWHSCVHGYWQLARLRRLFDDLPQRAEIDERFDEAFTEENIAAEVAYAADPKHAGFERPYGWAWLLMLSDELMKHDDDAGRNWHAQLYPLAQLFAGKFVDFLPRATYPTRAGTHGNSAFANVLAMQYARSHGDQALESLLISKARKWFGSDVNCQAWEPSQNDFLSPALIEAMCMSRLLARGRFRQWFANFLPAMVDRQPAALFLPATVSDRTDGQTSHLDGLNLSRAWCFRSIAHIVEDSLADVLNAAANEHLQASLPHLFDHYAGEHWLATFALLALSETIG
jgi:hypothetical protein